MAKNMYDMWKAAQHMKKEFEFHGERDVEITNLHIKGKFVYFVSYPVMCSNNNLSLLRLDKFNDIFHTDNILGLDVRYDHIIIRGHNNTIYYGVCIK